MSADNRLQPIYELDPDEDNEMDLDDVLESIQPSESANNESELFDDLYDQ